MANPDLIAGITAVVNGETPPEPTPPAADPPADEPADDTPPADEPKADLIGTPPADEPAAEGEDEPAGGPARGPDGKFVAKAPKEGEPPAAAAPEAKKDEPKPAPKVMDPVNDPVPPNAKPETRERIQTLAGMVKERESELAQVKADFDMLYAPIQESGATAEQFQEMVTLLKYINSPHQHEQMKALQYLQGAGALLAERLGQVPPGADPLAGQADLLQAVNAGHLTRQYAEEVAKARRQAQAAQQFSQQAQQRSQQEQQRQAAIQRGQAAVRTLEQTLEASDPQFKAKMAVILSDNAFKNHLRTAVPPEQWAVALAEKYRTVQVAAPVAPAAPSAPSPLRAKQPAGTAAKQPTTMLEAVKAAVAAPTARAG
jgi:hypothetical protein